MKKKNGTKKFDLHWRGFELWIFEQVPANNLNFEGDKINRAHGSSKISTSSKERTEFSVDVHIKQYSLTQNNSSSKSCKVKIIRSGFN